MENQTLPEAQILETERLYLKVMTPELWNYALTQLPDEDISQQLGLYTPESIAKEKEKNRLGMTTHAISFRLYVMVEKLTGTVIGKIGYHNWQQRHNRSEIGYAMDLEQYKNRGFMTEAMKTVLDDGFGEMGLYRVEAMISPENTPSLKLVDRYGFVKEGLLRAHYNNNGVQVDSAVYGLLRPEYEQLKHT
jgi:[ribosomal protein S5]-alanine N-acetyltransferase